MRPVFGWVLLSLLIGMLIVGGYAPRPVHGDQLPSYRNEEYGFTISLPAGWMEDKVLSREATEQARRGEKDALAISFVGGEKVDPFGLNLAIIFRPADPKYQDPSERRKYIDKIKEAMAGDPRDEIYRAKEASFSGQPAVEVTACTTYEGRQGNNCNIVHHYLEIFAPQVRIQVQFTVWKQLYLKYKDEIERSIASIEISPRAALPPPRCKESDIEVVEHHWDTGGRFKRKTDIKWEATLKNTSQVQCLVKVRFELLDQAGEVIFEDNLAPPQVIDPQQTKKEYGSGRMIDNDDLSKVRTSRLVLVKVQ